MKPERWQKLDELFDAAVRHEPARRSAFLDAACAGDESMRSQVAALLDAHDKAGSFIEGDALQLEARALANAHDVPGNILAVGEVIGHYRIVSLLGAGGMGEVYLAQDTKLGREVALKVLSDLFTNDPDRVRRFQQEARAASSLNHPNIITIYEIGQVGGLHFIATEYIEGETLRQQINDSRSNIATGENLAVQFNKVLNIAMQVADALAAAHAKGIVHRDIKPENIMLVRDRRLMPAESLVKVLDFGIAKLTEPEANGNDTEAATRVLLNTREGSAIGTVSHMSPEQARGKPVDVRTDVWSLGVVLYEMVSNSLPFRGNTSQDVIASILKDEPAPLPLKIPDRLSWIIEKALRKDQDERYQTVREMFSDLHELHKSRSELSLTGRIPFSTEEGGTSANSEVRTRAEQRQFTSAEKVGRSLVSRIAHLPKIAIVVLAVLLFAAGVVVIGLYKLPTRNRLRITQNQPKAAVASQTMKLTRLTSTGKASAAVISPDGKSVVHVVKNGLQQSLWLRQVATSSNIQISPPAEVDYYGLTFSPDGDSLYFCLWDRKSYVALYKMPIYGGGAKKLIEDIDSAVTFSPDGKQLAFLRGYPTEQKTAVVVSNPDGTSEQKLTTHMVGSGPFGDPAWSPDGKIIAYPAENTDANGDFMTILETRVTDGSEKPISSRRWWRVWRMAWLRDGSGIIFAANERLAGPSQIWYVSYPDGEVHRITNDLNDYVDISLSADSSSLVTVQSEQNSNIWIAPNDNLHNASQITSGKFDGLMSLSWSPDGKVVYGSAANGRMDLWAINSNGSGQKQLTEDTGNNSWPSVSPDGRYVVFVSDRTGTNHIWRINADGGNPTQLTSGTGETHPQCSPDSQWVIFNSKSSEAPLMKVPIVTGEAVPIKVSNVGGVAVSPDGKWIASTHYERANINTAIYPVDGGEPRKLIDFAGYYFRWTPDGHSLAYVDERNSSAIIAQPIDGGRPRQLADFTPDYVFSFAWANDGKQLAVARGSVTHDVILISNFINGR
jgi:serine/threonine protein kinase